VSRGINASLDSFSFSLYGGEAAREIFEISTGSRCMIFIAAQSRMCGAARGTTIPRGSGLRTVTTTKSTTGTTISGSGACGMQTVIELDRVRPEPVAIKVASGVPVCFRALDPASRPSFGWKKAKYAGRAVSVVVPETSRTLGCPFHFPHLAWAVTQARRGPL